MTSIVGAASRALSRDANNESDHDGDVDEEEVDKYATATRTGVLREIHTPSWSGEELVTQPKRKLKDFSGTDIEGSGVIITPQTVLLHIYDLSENFAAANELLSVAALGGAFHGGVEVYSNEWSYGRAGVENVRPRCCDGHVYRCSLLIGDTTYSEMEVAEVLQNLCQTWQGADYDLFGHNCCSFCNAFVDKLGVGPLPPWVDRFARLLDSGCRAGKKIQSVLSEGVNVIQRIASPRQQLRSIRKTSERRSTSLPTQLSQRSPVADFDTSGEDQGSAASKVRNGAMHNNSSPNVIIYRAPSPVSPIMGCASPSRVKATCGVRKHLPPKPVPLVSCTPWPPQRAQRVIVRRVSSPNLNGLDDMARLPGRGDQQASPRAVLGRHPSFDEAVESPTARDRSLARTPSIYSTPEVCQADSTPSTGACKNRQRSSSPDVLVAKQSDMKRSQLVAEGSLQLDPMVTPSICSCAEDQLQPIDSSPIRRLEAQSQEPCSPVNVQNSNERETGTAKLSDHAPSFPDGSWVEYYSASQECWISTQVLRFHRSVNRYDLDRKAKAEPSRIRFPASSEATSNSKVMRSDISQELDAALIDETVRGQPSPQRGASRKTCEIDPQAKSNPTENVRQEHTADTRDENIRLNPDEHFPVGSAVEYLSASKGVWMQAKVLGFHPSSGCYDLDCKPQADPQRIRLCKASSGDKAVIAASNVQASQKISAQNMSNGAQLPSNVGYSHGPMQSFAIGSLVEYLSITQGIWIQTKVLHFHVVSGLYDLECKAQAEPQRIRQAHVPSALHVR